MHNNLQRQSHTTQSSYLSHMIAAANYSYQYWHCHRSDYRNTLIYAQTISRTLPTGDIILGLLALHAQEAPRLCGINHATHVLLVSFNDGNDVRRGRKNVTILLGGFVHVFRGEGGNISLGNNLTVRSLVRTRFCPYVTDPNKGAVLHS